MRVSSIGVDNLSKLCYCNGMKLQRVYIDTSVIGGCFDAEFATESNRLMQDFAAGRLKAVVSDIVAIEVNQGFDKLQAQFQQLLASQPEWVNVTEEVVILADAYQSHKILTPKYYADGLHIALATIVDIDVLVSWNSRTSSTFTAFDCSMG